MNTTGKSIDHYVNALEGISYRDWVKIKTAVDGSFEKQRSEAERGLCLTSADDVKNLIHSQFG